MSEGQLTKIVPLFMRAERVNGGLGLLTSDIGIAYGILELQLLFLVQLREDILSQKKVEKFNIDFSGFL